MRITKEIQEKIYQCKNPHFKRTMVLKDKGKLFECYECPDGCPFTEFTNAV